MYLTLEYGKVFLGHVQPRMTVDIRDFSDAFGGFLAVLFTDLSHLGEPNPFPACVQANHV